MFTGLENPTHILMLLLLVLLFFGSRRLPEIGRSLGTGMREFKDSLTGSSEARQLPATTAQTEDGRRPDEPRRDAS